MSLLRVRLSSFLAGFAVAGGIAMIQLQRQLQTSHKFLSEQQEIGRRNLELRLARLEEVIGRGDSGI